MARLVKRYLHPDLEFHFPNLTRAMYEVMSDATLLSNSNVIPPYNCIAFAAGDDVPVTLTGLQELRERRRWKHLSKCLNH